MSGHPSAGHYDDGYDRHPRPTDSYYHDDQNQAYYDDPQNYQQHPQQPHGGDGYYDES